MIMMQPTYRAVLHYVRQAVYLSRCHRHIDINALRRLDFGGEGAAAYMAIHAVAGSTGLTFYARRGESPFQANTSMFPVGFTGTTQLRKRDHRLRLYSAAAINGHSAR
jgi:hypothetical protein